MVFPNRIKLVHTRGNNIDFGCFKYVFSLIDLGCFGSPYLSLREMKSDLVYNEFYSKIFYPSHENMAMMSSKVNWAPFPSGCGKSDVFLLLAVIVS